jgi:chemosensory pili system protein ChpA (sensor histidine kinase/response regulator)
MAKLPTVMVVDDSLTVRKITGRLLAREGYQVITAKDGVEALELLLDVLPDVMLVDIEMPRLDGFDLTRNIRADARLRGIPIIMITSRTAEKHRSYAFEIGVNHYLGKPYPEDELLQLVAGYVRQQRVA